MGTDAAGNERAKVLEYELPLNFRLQKELLTSQLCAIRFQMREYLGFMFESNSDAVSFMTTISELADQLSVNTEDVEAIREHCKQELDDVYQKQLAEAIADFEKGDISDIIKGI